MELGHSMRLHEIEIDPRKKLLDSIRNEEVSSFFYAFYETHKRITHEFMYTPIRFYSPDEIIDILKVIELYEIIIPELYIGQDQIRVMLSELVEYFNL
jgi:hypothetical protein